eukprot:g5833.t1
MPMQMFKTLGRRSVSTTARTFFRREAVAATGAESSNTVQEKKPRMVPRTTVNGLPVSIASSEFEIHKSLSKEPTTPGQHYQRIQWDYRGKFPPSKKRFHEFLETVKEEKHVPVTISMLSFYVSSLKTLVSKSGRVKTGLCLDDALVDAFAIKCIECGGNGPQAAVAALSKSTAAKGFDTKTMVKPETLLKLLSAIQTTDKDTAALARELVYEVRLMADERQTADLALELTRLNVGNSNPIEVLKSTKLALRGAGNELEQNSTLRTQLVDQLVKMATDLVTVQEEAKEVDAENDGDEIEDEKENDAEGDAIIEAKINHPSGITYPAFLAKLQSLNGVPVERANALATDVEAAATSSDLRDLFSKAKEDAEAAAKEEVVEEETVEEGEEEEEEEDEEEVAKQAKRDGVIAKRKERDQLREKYIEKFLADVEAEKAKLVERDNDPRWKKLKEMYGIEEHSFAVEKEEMNDAEYENYLEPENTNEIGEWPAQSNSSQFCKGFKHAEQVMNGDHIRLAMEALEARRAARRENRDFV